MRSYYVQRKLKNTLRSSVRVVSHLWNMEDVSWFGIIVFLWLSGRALRQQCKGCGFDSQETHTDKKKCISWMHCKLLWIKASAKCKCLGLFCCVLTGTACRHWWNNEFWIISATSKGKHQDICLRTESQENVGHAARQQPQAQVILPKND